MSRIFSTPLNTPPGMPNVWRTSVPGGVGAMPVLGSMGLYPNPGQSFDITSVNGGGPAFPYPGTLGKSGPGRNDMGQFAPQFGGSGAPADVVEPTTIITQGTKFLTNGRIHWSTAMDHRSLPYDASLQRGFYVFHRKGTGGSTVGNGDPIMSRLSVTDAAEMMVLPLYASVPVANFYLAAESSNQTEDITSREVCTTFAATGSIVSIMGEMRNDGTPTISAAFGMSGPEHIFNMWGEELPSRTPLWFLIKMGNIPDTYALDPSGYAVDSPKMFQGKVPKKRCMQIIPWANAKQGTPTAADVAYIDNSGTKCFGSAIRVGTVQHYTPPSHVSDYTRQSSAFSIPALLSCDKMYASLETPKIYHFD